MKRPIIGLTLDWSAQGEYSKYPWYAIRENYCEAVAQAGGTPLPLPHHCDSIDTYLNLIDGLIITGGDFDIDPALYGQIPSHPRVILKKKRGDFEYGLVKKALMKDIAILGICGGHQLLNVALGGTLIQHIPAEWSNPLAHEQPNPRHEASHTVTIRPHTRLAQTVGQEEIFVNSAHHQAIKQVAPGLTVNAVASDGIIEGIEDPQRRFCIGVQWHPEFIIGDADKQLFQTFIIAAGT